MFRRKAEAALAELFICQVNQIAPVDPEALERRLILTETNVSEPMSDLAYVPLGWARLRPQNQNGNIYLNDPGTTCRSKLHPIEKLIGKIDNKLGSICKRITEIAYQEGDMQDRKHNAGSFQDFRESNSFNMRSNTIVELEHTGCLALESKMTVMRGRVQLISHDRLSANCTYCFILSVSYSLIFADIQGGGCDGNSRGSRFVYLV
jgi:hypothetical protein